MISSVEITPDTLDVTRFIGEKLGVSNDNNLSLGQLLVITHKLA